MKRKTKKFLKGLGMRTVAMFLFTYFSVAVTVGSFLNPTPSILAAGLYFSTELSRFLGMNTYPKNRRNHTFLI